MITTTNVNNTRLGTLSASDTSMRYIVEEDFSDTRVESLIT